MSLIRVVVELMSINLSAFVLACSRSISQCRRTRFCLYFSFDTLILPPPVPSKILDACERRPARCAIRIDSDVFAEESSFFAEDLDLALSRKGYDEDPKIFGRSKILANPIITPLKLLILTLMSTFYTIIFKFC